MDPLTGMAAIASELARRIRDGDYQAVPGVFTSTPTANSVFICYRRQDTAWAAIGIRTS